MKNWKLAYETFNPEEEGLREALCTLGNGFFASRGAAPESKADKTHSPGTYIAGCYNRLKSEIGGRTIENESLVNIPNWLELNFRIEGGDWFDINTVHVIDFHQELDIKQAILKRKVIFEDQEGRQTQVEQWRLVSIDQPHLAALKTIIHAQDWSGTIEIRSALDARVTNAGVKRYRDLSSHHLKALSSGSIDDDAIWLEAETNQSRVCISQAATTRMWQGEQRLELTPQVDQSEGYIAQHFTTGLNQGQTLRIEKIFSLYTSREHAISEPVLEARKAVSSTPEGIHTGAMAGTVDLIQRCFSGIAVHGDVLWLNPSLPKGLNCLILNIQYRKHLLNIHMTTSCVRITTESSVKTTIKIGLGENIYELHACEVRDFQL